MRERGLSKKRAMRGIESMLVHLGDHGHEHPEMGEDGAGLPALLQALEEATRSHPPMTKRRRELDDLD